MAIISPTRGGFLRPFGCGIFIRDFLLGRGPHGSAAIDPRRGACQNDIWFHYKQALFRAYAEDAVAREQEKRIRRGLDPYTDEEYAERVDRHFRRIPYKLVKARYHSFRRYFHYLKQLEWVEFTGEEERSVLQEETSDHPTAEARKFYRLTREGIEAPEEHWSNPQRVLYAMIGDEDIEDYIREKRREHKYRRPGKYDHFLRPFTAGMFIREYLMGLGPEDSPKDRS